MTWQLQYWETSIMLGLLHASQELTKLNICQIVFRPFLKKVWNTNSLTPRQVRTSTLWDHSPMLCHLCHHPTPFWWKRLEFIEKLKKETSTIFEDPFQDEKMFFKKTKFPQTIRISKNCNNLKEKNESVRWKIIKIKSIIGIYHWKYPMSNSASMYVSTAYSS